MRPDVVIFYGEHAYKYAHIPINQQAAIKTCPVTIGDDTWIGIRAVILPRVVIGKGAVIGPSSVVTKSILDFAVVAGKRAPIINWRKTLEGMED